MSVASSPILLLAWSWPRYGWSSSAFGDPNTAGVMSPFVSSWLVLAGVGAVGLSAGGSAEGLCAGSFLRAGYYCAVQLWPEGGVFLHQGVPMHLQSAAMCPIRAGVFRGVTAREIGSFGLVFYQAVVCSRPRFGVNAFLGCLPGLLARSSGV